MITKKASWRLNLSRREIATVTDPAELRWLIQESQRLLENPAITKSNAGWQRWRIKLGNQRLAELR